MIGVAMVAIGRATGAETVREAAGVGSVHGAVWEAHGEDQWEIQT